MPRPARHKAEIILLNTTDHFLYLPLLPQVAAGVLEPRRVTVSLTSTLPQIAGRNVAASLGIGERRTYRHRDLGFTVDLGGAKVAANPLGIPLSGPLAEAVTRGYHLADMPGNRVRVAVDWLLDAVLPRQAVQLGLVRSRSVPLDTASPELAHVRGRR
ncbi:hypothetical protein ACWFR5_37160 [Streptomyces sp. NPDC055092]